MWELLINGRVKPQHTWKINQQIHPSFLHSHLVLHPEILRAFQHALIALHVAKLSKESKKKYVSKWHIQVIKCQSQKPYKTRSSAQYSGVLWIWIDRTHTDTYSKWIVCITFLPLKSYTMIWEDCADLTGFLLPFSMWGSPPFVFHIRAGFSSKGAAFHCWGVTSHTQLSGALSCTSFTQFASAIHWPKAKSSPVYCCFLFGINQTRCIHICLVWRQ